MDLANSVRVSPRHHVSIDETYLSMVKRAPSEDFVVRTLAKRMAGELPLMSGDLVIAGAATREAYPLAAEYPLHFRKTYYPGRLHGDPCLEFDRHSLASALVDLPKPIGCARTTFRSCLLPGRPLDGLSGLGTEPDGSNIASARALGLDSLAGLWQLTEEAFAIVEALQAGGMTHGDAHLHNFMVCPSPLEVLPVDFERALVRDECTTDQWELRCAEDRRYLLRHAIFLQCGLGRQRGVLADAALASVDTLVQPAASFRRAIAERTYGDLT